MKEFFKWVEKVYPDLLPLTVIALGLPIIGLLSAYFPWHFVGALFVAVGIVVVMILLWLIANWIRAIKEYKKGRTG